MLPTLNPVAFSIFGLDVMWYGVLIASSMLLAMYISFKRAPLHGVDPERLLDIALISIPISIIGARAYYVIFNWDYYAGDLLKIINTRQGGLAIHGGLLAGFSVGVLLCRRWKINPLNALDLAAPAVALAQSIGRWGNYFNQEAYGGPTTLPWAININGQLVHPTFLYESIWCLLLFFFLLAMDKRRRFQGQIFLLYGMLYSLERFFVEGLRTDSLMVGSLRQAQVISAVIGFTCLAVYVYLSRRNSCTECTENQTKGESK